jgi:hypothetical protein
MRRQVKKQLSRAWTNALRSAALPSPEAFSLAAAARARSAGATASRQIESLQEGGSVGAGGVLDPAGPALLEGRAVAGVVELLQPL